MLEPWASPKGQPRRQNLLVANGSGTYIEKLYGAGICGIEIETEIALVGLEARRHREKRWWQKKTSPKTF